MSSQPAREPTPGTAAQVRRGRGPGQAKRADAVRNRQRVVDAAHQVFAERGPDVSVREVAKAAGVGLGTIYRHFPDKEALFAAVVEKRFRSLARETRTAIDTMTPWAAFAHMMRRMAEMMTEDRAMSGVIGPARMRPPGPPDYDENDESDVRVQRDRARDELDAALSELAASAKEAGELRKDVGPRELGLSLAGVGFSLGPPDGPPMPTDSPPPWAGYLEVVLDGLHESSRDAARRGTR